MCHGTGVISTNFELGQLIRFWLSLLILRHAVTLTFDPLTLNI